MSRVTKSLRPLLVAAGAAGLLASALAASPAVATPDVAPAPGQVTTTASFPPTELTFTAALPYDRRGLLRAARAISSPGSSSYRNFLTLKDAATRFGATPAQRAALRKVATDLGMKVTFSPTGLTARLTAPVATWTDLYGADPITVPRSPWTIVAYFDMQTGAWPPPTPAPLRSTVRMILAETSILDTATPSATRTTPRAMPLSTDDTPPINEGTPFGPGEKCLGPGADTQLYSPSQIHVPYGTAALHARGLRGEGVRIANLGGGYAYSQSALDYAADCFDFRAPPVRFTGGPGVGPTPVFTEGDIEGDLDVQVIAAVAPEATRIDFIEVASSILVYTSLVSAMDLVMTRVSPTPDVVTTSFGTCEAQISSRSLDRVRAVTDDHFALAATRGVTMLAAQGDGGSSDCTQFDANPPAALRVASVDYPASSPWVTGVGGTRIVLGVGNERVDEVVWNDLAFRGPTAGAGGGGSALTSRPWYQRPVTSADRRLVPDIAAHASAFPGWPLGQPGDGDPYLIPVAGTSAASPFSAANLALIAAAERKAGRGPLGFINPLLYDLAAKPVVYKTAFYDVTKGTNQLYFETSCCNATKGYDQASGLGAVHFDELSKLIPRPARR